MEVDQFFRDRRILVCGGAGFIGGHLVGALLGAGAGVEVIDPCVPGSGGSEKNLAPWRDAIAWQRVSTADTNAVRSALERCDLVFDAMGFTRHHLGLADPGLDLRLNYISHLDLVAALNDVPRPVVYLGSRGQFGRVAGTLQEDSPQHPLDVQGIHKSAAESLFRVYGARNGWPALSVRLDNCFGPGQPVEGEDLGLIGSFITSLRQGECVSLYGDGQRTRSISFAPDVARWLLQAAMRIQTGFSAINMLGPDVRLLELLDLLIVRIGRGSYRLTEFPAEIKLLDAGSAAVSRSAILAAVGDLPATPLPDAIEVTVEYFERECR